VSTSHPTLPPPRTASPPGVDAPIGDCDSFWGRQPSSGQGYNLEFENSLIALENRDRRARGLGNLVQDGMLKSIAASHAMDSLVSGWFRRPEFRNHVGRDGRDYQDRLADAEVAYAYASENVGDTSGTGTACDLVASFNQSHLDNYRGFHRPTGGSYEPLRSGTSCYLDYAARIAVCVQYFVSP
jgi:uncharacterized protein YkwD